MGALNAIIMITDDSGYQVGKPISEIYIYRTQQLVDTDDVYEYYAMRIPPNEVETVEMRTLMDYNSVVEIATPHVKFMHKYSDGAELCIARAIIALQEAGMNV